jgi:hypothetical protein
MSNFIDLTGKLFGYWTVLFQDQTNHGKRKRIYWMCRCACGQEKSILGDTLRHNGSKSCGCRMNEIRQDLWIKKYGSKSPRMVKVSIIKERLTLLFGDLITIDESTYRGTDARCRFIDVVFGEFFTAPKNVLYRGQGHHNRTQEKRERTCLKKFGFKTNLLNPENIELIKSTNLERYGSESPLGCEEVRKKATNTMIENYGVDNPMKNDKIKNKTKLTNLDRYGCENPMSNTKVRNKMKATNLKRYGMESPLSSPDIIQKRFETNRKRYGTIAPCQNHEVAVRNARSQTRAIKLRHWMTGGEIICIGSYEAKVVEYLNASHIE